VSIPVRHLLKGLAILASVTMTACGGNSSKTSSVPVQFVTPTSSPSVDQGQSVSLTVAVADGSAVSWTLQVGFGKPTGTLSNASGNSVTYTAPASVTGETQVSVVATAGSNSAAMPVFVEPAPAVTGTSSPTAATCPALGTVILPPALGAKSVGQTLALGDLAILESGGVAPFTWTVSSGSLPTGLNLSLSSDTSKASLIGTLSSPGCSTFTVQVTDAVGVSATSQSLNVAVVPAALKINAPNLGEAFIDSSNNGIPYPPVSFLATGGVPPYSWSLPQASGGQSALPPGIALSSQGVVAGVPSASGLLQNGGFGTYSTTIVVSDTQLPYPATAQPSVSISVFASDSSCETGNESNLTSQAPYAFLLRGFDANGPVTIAGNFTVDGAGAMTGGVEDITRSTGSQNNLSILPGSTYSLGRDNRGCITLTNSAGTTTTFRFSAGGCSSGRNSTGTGCQTPATGTFYLTTGHIIEFDDSTAAGTRLSGILRLQDSSVFQNSGVNGQYSFGLSGWDNSAGRFAIAGSATANAGSFTNINADSNDAGILSSNLTGGSGTFTINSAGRGTATLSLGTLSLDAVLYPVSANEVLISSTGSINATNPLVSGEAILSPGPYNFQSLQNSHMFHIAGLSTTGPDSSVGILTFDGVGGVTGTEYENQAGTLGTTALSGSYAVDSTTGRISFSSSSILNQNLGIHPLVGYVIPPPSTLTAASCNTPSACVTGFLISTDATAQAGVLEFQTSVNAPPPPFTLTSLVGRYVYGLDEPLDVKTADIVGFASASPVSSNLGTILQDTNYGDPTYCLESGCALLLPNNLLSGKYGINANGSGNFGGQTLSVTNGATTFVIDESPLNAHPGVVVVEQ